MDAESAVFLSAPTPRRDIPKKIARAAYEQVAPRWRLFWSAYLIIFGVYVLVFMLPSTLRLATQPSFITDDEKLSENHATAPGVVQSAVLANTVFRSVDASLYQFSFTFTPANASGGPAPREVKGRCYAEGRLWKDGEQVTVEYIPGHEWTARIQGGRASPFVFKPRSNVTGYVLSVLMAVSGILMLGMGTRNGLTLLKKRARCRWLLKNGTAAEFFVVDIDILRRKTWQNTGIIHVFQLKPVKETGDNHSYFSQLTKDSQVDYANTLRRSKTPTFGLYDPTSTDDKRLVLMV